ncbi:uncharacterized protein rab11fip5b [Genypterus blacodes]|uniref:uncharacterized protein rab11fip5b n=1 Tax=Genypterus blacodes TaxID=154954 RepID=UPI003F7647E2
MMSLIDLDDDQRWLPTHVNVTVLRARGLRTKGKHGSRYLYTIIQVGKEKYTTGLVEKAEVPEWNEECCFELLPCILEEGGRGAYPPGSGDLVLTVMHRVLIGLDVFLGQAVIPLDKMFQDAMCPRDEWVKLNSKTGRKEKERGQLQVTVQFTRNNMTASMFDLTIKDKPRSAFGKLKDRVTGRKRGDVESSSAIVPGRYAALSGSLGQPFGEEGGGGGTVEPRDVEITEEKRSKMKDFFKGRLRKSSDTKSCSSLASESSVSSMASDNPPPSLDLLADPPTSPIYTSKVRLDSHYGEADLAKKVLTSQHTTKVLTHKRAFSDEASKITTTVPRANLAVESLKGQTMTQSKSSLCINGSHVYDSEPSTPRSSGALQSKLVLLEKCSPLSRSLQNLTKRSEDKFALPEGRRWSFDKFKKEEKEEEKDPHLSSPPNQRAQAAAPVLASAPESPDIGRKLRKTLFSGGRSDSLPSKSELSQVGATSEGKLRGWFGSNDPQNKPRLEVSPKVESSSDEPPPLPPRSSLPPQHSSPSASSPTCHASTDNGNHANPSTPPSSSPASTPISPSNPFLLRMQRNPFFEELIAEELGKSPPFGSSYLHHTALPSQPCIPIAAPEVKGYRTSSIKRDRPRSVARQVSLPAILPRSATVDSPSHCAPRSMSESAGEWDDSFDAFATSRFNLPKGSRPQKQLRSNPKSPQRHSSLLVDINNPILEFQIYEQEPPPLPPRRPIRTPVNEIYSDGWLHRGQELAVHKEAYLLSQTGAASRQHGREGESKRNTPSISPDCHTSSETSDSLSAHSQPYATMTSPAVTPEEKLKKFKYEPLEYESDCWGGMLFEQDLYGRIGSGNYGQPKVNSKVISVHNEESAGNKFTQQADLAPEVRLDSEISAAELVTTTLRKSDMTLDITPTAVESKVETSPNHSAQLTNVNNNVSNPLILGDLNMNDSDFSFIDSDGSPQSETINTLKVPGDSGDNSVQHSEDTLSLQDPCVPEMNSSFETPASPNKLCKVSPVCQDNCQDCQSELSHVALRGDSTLNREIAALSPHTETSNHPDLQTECTENETGDGHDIKQTQETFDDNANPRAKLASSNPKEPFSRVRSARVRPKGWNRNHNSDSPTSQVRREGEFEQLSLVQNISEVSEGPFSYQPAKLSLHSSLAADKQTAPPAESTEQEHTLDNDFNRTSLIPSEDGANIELSALIESYVAEKVSFEDFHAKLAPNSKIGQSLQGSEPSPIPSALPGAQAELHPTPALCSSIPPSSTGHSAGAKATLAVASCTSCSTSSATAQPPVDARPLLLPEETQPANNLPHQESRSHPVKPLTSSQLEKKESRSVLEKLKSSIHHGRGAHQAAAEPETQEVMVDTSAQYQHLTNMELISLLLQQEMDMQKQQAASERQGAQLEKCEGELKKVKLQARDLEDYIDNLLLRIMEQTPTLLQVRNRRK